MVVTYIKVFIIIKKGINKIDKVTFIELIVLT